MPTTFQIHLIVEKDRMGDRNNVLGVFHAIRDTLMSKGRVQLVEEERSPADEKAEQISAPLYLESSDAANIQNLIEQLEKPLDENDPVFHILIGAGSDALKTLRQLPTLAPGNKKNAFAFYSSHQMWNDLPETLPHIDLLALPEYLPEWNDPEWLAALEKNNTPVKKLLGVPHHMSLESIADEFEAWQNNETNWELVKKEDALTVGVLLGGDTQKPDGSWQGWTVQNAHDFAHLLIEMAKKMSSNTRPVQFLITNGPRTGKNRLDAVSKQWVPADDGKHDGSSIDTISQLIIFQLAMQNLSKQVNNTAKLFDYHVKTPSALKPILHLADQVVITGDQTSGITEIQDVFGTWNEKNPDQKRQLYIIPIDSMNPTHEAHMASIQKSHLGAVIAVNAAAEFEALTEDAVVQSHPGTAQVAAEALLKAIEKTLLHNIQTKEALTLKVAQAPESTAAKMKQDRSKLAM